MSKQISLDMGFDRKALTKPGDENCCLLYCGLTRMGSIGNPVVVARRLRPGYEWFFTLYDLTVPTATSSPVDGLSVKIEFNKARKQLHKSPVDQPTYDKFAIFQGKRSPGFSDVFEASYPRWGADLETGAGARYPANQLVPHSPKSLQPSLILQNEGHFYFTLHLKVWWSEGGTKEEKDFRIDPEIILSNNGP